MHLLLRGNRQLHRTATRTNRDQHIRGGGGRQQPDGVRRWLLDGLEQYVRGALGHALGVLEQNHTPATHRRAVLGFHDQLARLLDADVRGLGPKVREVRVRTVHHGHAALALTASAVLRFGLFAEQGRGKHFGRLAMGRAGRARKQPSVGRA